MDFSLPEELEMLRDMVRDFSNEKIAPFADEWDEKHYFPYEEVMKPMGELGLYKVKEGKFTNGRKGRKTISMTFSTFGPHYSNIPTFHHSMRETKS